jgi:hypothetical protein
MIVLQFVAFALGTILIPRPSHSAPQAHRRRQVYHLLEEHLLPYWGKLSFGGSNAWESFLNNIAANAVYEVLRATIIGILVLSGLYVSRERQLIGAQIEKQREKEWEEELAEHRRQNQNEGIETDLGE